MSDHQGSVRGVPAPAKRMRLGRCPAPVHRWIAFTVLIHAIAGCAAPPRPRAAMLVDSVTFRSRAKECLRAAAGDGSNPAVRVAAVESMRALEDVEYLPWIRTALADAHPGVRFAGAVAVGELRDAVARTAVRRLLDDGDESVRAAAIFALHRLGDRSRTSRLGTFLLNAENPLVRRNAAMLLGLLGESGSVPLLARAMADRDEGVRRHALEAMARLGNDEARRELVYLSNAGIGADEVFALQALASTGDPVYVDTFRYKLSTAGHIETRLAAAQGLARFGMDEGLGLALEAARFPKANSSDAEDPRAGQMLRVRLLACRVLGTLRRAEAEPVLARLMAETDDARVRVASASALLLIRREDGGPFSATAGTPGRP